MTFEATRKDKFCWYCHLKCYEENVLDDSNITYECTECFRVYHEKCVKKPESVDPLFKPLAIKFKCDECAKITTGQKIPREQMEKYCKMFEHAISLVKSSEVMFFFENFK